MLTCPLCRRRAIRKPPRGRIAAHCKRCTVIVQNRKRREERRFLRACGVPTWKIRGYLSREARNRTFAKYRRRHYRRLRRNGVPAWKANGFASREACNVYQREYKQRRQEQLMVFD